MAKVLAVSDFVFWCADAHKVKVTAGRTYLLRVVNACLNFGLFFAVANHTLNVVQLDSAYVEPFTVDTVLIAPGQTLDALLTANQSTGSYYMAASPYSVPDPAVVSFESWQKENDSCFQVSHQDIISSNRCMCTAFHFGVCRITS